MGQQIILQNFLKGNKSRPLKRCGRYPIVFIFMKEYKLAHWVGCKKTYWNTLTVCMQSLYHNAELENPPTDNINILQNYIQTNCQIVTPILLKSIGKILGQYVFWTQFCRIGTYFVHWLKWFLDVLPDLAQMPS